MVMVNALQAIYLLLSASPSTSTLSKQLNAQLINVRASLVEIFVATEMIQIPVEQTSSLYRQLYSSAHSNRTFQ